MTRVGELEILIKTTGAKKTKKEVSDVDKEFKKTAKAAAKHSKEMTKFAQKFGGIIGIIAASLTATIGLLFSQVPIVQQIFGALSVIVTMLALMLDEVLRPALEPVVDWLFWLAEKFDALPGPIKKAITVFLVTAGILGLIAVVVVAVIAAVITFGAVMIAVGVIAGLFVVLIALIVTWIVNLIDWFKLMRPIVKGVIADVTNYFKEKWAEAMDFFEDFANGFTGTATAMFSVFRTGYDALMDFFGLSTTDKLTAIKTAFETTFNSIATFLGDKWDTIKTKFESTIALIKAKWDAFWTNAKSFATGVVNGIITLFTSIPSMLKSALNTAISAMNSGINSLNSISVTVPDWVPEIGGETWSLGIPNIPSVFTQGRITEGGVARVERGESIVKDRSMKLAFLEALQESGVGGGGTFYFYLDGQRMTVSVNRHNDRNMNQSGVF